MKNGVLGKSHIWSRRVSAISGSFPQSLGCFTDMRMRKFYLTFPKSHAPHDQLTWTHYRLLMKVEKEKARQFYLEELRQELQREYQVLDDVMQNEAGGVTIFRLPLQDWYRNLLPPGSRKY